MVRPPEAVAAGRFDDVAERLGRDIRPSLRYTASTLGYAITLFVVWWQWTVNFGGHLPPDLGIWDRVGDQVRAGVSPYSVADLSWTGFFFYAPPWALAFGAVSWLPEIVQAGLVMGVSVAALRYVAGSWLRVGYLGLCPITGGELGNGSLNLVVAAAILAAMRGDGRLAALAALAKVSPILAVHPRDWRRPLLTLGVAVAMTLPVLGWWADWGALFLYTQEHYRIGYDVPLPLRGAVAIAVLVSFRWSPRARGFAAAFAIPALYSYSLVLFYPLVSRPRPLE